MKFNEIKDIYFLKRIENGDIFIPEEILAIKELNMNEKIYLSLYINYNKNIDRTDNYIKDIISNVTLIKIKNKLKKLNYIEDKVIYDVSQAKELTIKLSHTGKVCEWCKNESYILQSHHFPIPKRKGGKEVVFDNNNYCKKGD